MFPTSTTVERELRRASAATFESLAFICEAPENGVDDENSLQEAVQVKFRGPFVGRLVLRADASLMATIAGNMLADVASPPRTLQRDALGEIANVICGNVLPSVAGGENIFHLEAPAAVQPCRPSPLPREALLGCVLLPMDEGNAEVTVFATREQEEGDVT